MVFYFTNHCKVTLFITGKVIWEYVVPLFGRAPEPGHGREAYGNKVFSAVRLENGNTLMATGNGHSVLEVTPDKHIVWRYEGPRRVHHFQVLTTNGVAEPAPALK